MRLDAVTGPVRANVIGASASVSASASGAALAASCAALIASALEQSARSTPVAVAEPCARRGAGRPALSAG